MTALDGYKLTDRFAADRGTVFLTGIQALARLPLEQLRADRRAGHNTAAFVSGYQGSPLGGYGDAVVRANRVEPDLPVVFEQGVNEELAATAVMGSQLAAARPDARYDGVVGIWYGKAPGVDRAADALRHAVFAGTSMLGGAVAIVGDDPNAKSSTVPSSSAGLAADMHMPLLYPGDPAEALDLGRHAIALSRVTGLWSALKIVADVADATATVSLDPDRVQPIMTLHDGVRYQHVPDGRLLTPHTVDLEREIVEVRYELARRYASENGLNRTTVDPADAWIGIVSSGITYREVREALARLGIDDDQAIDAAGIRLLKMGMPMPFNPDTIRHFARGLETLLVVEEKQPNIESLIKDALYAANHRPKVIGKVDAAGTSLLPAWGALDADGLVPILRRVLAPRLDDRMLPERTQRERILIPVGVEREPFFCSGCPHNRSTQVPDGAVVGAGIGCHTMVLLMDEDRVGDIAGITVMGNEGAQWIGMSPFVDTDHLIQNVGDGTYFHSAQLAVQASVAANVNVTYKLLYNGTVAMTGGQDPQGQLGVEAVVTTLLAQGVSRVLITTDDTSRYHGRSLPSGVDVWDRSRLIEAQEMLATVLGVTVLIHDQECAAEQRRDRKRGLIETPDQRVVINNRICEGCGDCGEVSNCLSVQAVDTPFGQKREIDQTSCNLDYSCLDGDCPSFMTVTQNPGRVTKALNRLTRSRRGPQSTGVGATTLRVPPTVPEPRRVVSDDPFNLRITGIGGTGVVTVAQILGTAAMLDGYEVRGLDQIGLSQKAGPVVSDVRMSRSTPSHTNRLGQNQADLLLAFDQLVAASAKGLDACDHDHTIVVGSNSATPTGEMVTNDTIELPMPTELEQTIRQASADVHHWADAQQICEELFGSSSSANVFVLGMAVQAGALPIQPECVEQAIELNGVAVETNVAAFRWGRFQVHDPAFAQASLGPESERVDNLLAIPKDISSQIAACAVDELQQQRLLVFAHELIEWGGRPAVDQWLKTLLAVAHAQAALTSTDQRLVDATAAGLFKLIAYKDEYEVARLMVLSDGLHEAQQLAGADGSVAWKLHPPMLRALGMDRKISIPVWATPAIRFLANGQRLRGTVADPFRWAQVRKVERELAQEYAQAMTHVVSVLSEDTLEAAIQIAGLPDLVRGYEDIKLASVVNYRLQLNDRLASITDAAK